MIVSNFLVGWAMSILVALTPQADASKEDPELRRDRLASIAQDITDVVYDEEEDPLFSGPHGREKSLIMVATWAHFESGGFSAEVDKGRSRGDGGSSWCLMQLHIGKGKTPEGWTGRDLIEDRKKCIRSGYRILKLSWRTCRGADNVRGAAYISGRCDWAVDQSKLRYKRAMQLFNTMSLDSYIASQQNTCEPFNDENRC